MFRASLLPYFRSELKGFVCLYFTIVFVVIVLPCLSYAQPKVWDLQGCIEYAYKNDVGLNQQILTTEAIGINYKQAKDNLWPNLSLTDAESFNFGNTINSNTNQVIHQNTSSNYPSLSSTVTLFNGFKYMNLVKENKQNYEASKLDIETQKNNLALNITAAYVQILFDHEAVNIAQHQIESDSVEVKRMEMFVAVGQTPEDSLLIIRAQLATDRAAKVTTQMQVELANVQLEQLMEMPIVVNFAIATPDENGISPDISSSAAEVYDIAARILPDEKSAALKTNAFETDLLVNKASLLPSLNLTGGLSTEYYSALTSTNYQTTYRDETIGYLQNNPSQLVTGPVLVTNTTSQPYSFSNQFKNNFSQVIALSLSVPIFNNFKARNNIRLAKIAVENARLNEQAVKNTLRKNVETAYTNQVAGSKTFIATKEQLISETRAFADMTKKFNVGLTNVTDYLVEENNYYKAVLANLQAKYQYIFETKVVAFYTGTPITK